MSRLTVAPLAEFDPSGGRVKITAPYGDGRGHQGVDWGTTDGIEVGTTLYAPVDGTLENTGYDGPYTPSGGHTAGNWLFWRGDNGTRWKMFHLDTVTVPIGSWHAAGSPIARVGNSGTQAAHLHLEEHAGGWGNPVDFTNDAYEVIDAGRWPGTPPAPPKDWFDMATKEELAQVVEDLLKKYTNTNSLWQDHEGQFEVTFNGDGNRVRRRIRTPAEADLLRVGRQLNPHWVTNVGSSNQTTKDAFYSWPVTPE
jgi:hypothetical protein